MMKKAQVRISPLWLVFGCFGKRHLRGTAGGGDVSFWIRCASMCFFLLLHVAASGACRGHPVALTAHQVSVADSHWVWDTPEVACPDWPTCILERCFPTCNCGQALAWCNPANFPAIHTFSNAIWIPVILSFPWILSFGPSVCFTLL